MTLILSPVELASRITSGTKLGVPGDYAGAAVTLVRQVIDSGARDLHVVCAPTAGLQVDMLIGAGRVATVETSAVSLGEAGGAPCFVRAVREGAIRVMDATCPAVLTGLLASEKGVPFMPMRGLLGSDILRVRADWKVIDNPFAAGDEIVAIPAIRPDVCLFHAPEADRSGNVRIGRRRELMLLAHASAQTLVTVERISETSLMRGEATAAGVLPALYVDAIAEVRHGAWPTGLWGEYPADDDELARYAAAARTREGFEAYMFARRRAA